MFEKILLLSFFDDFVGGGGARGADFLGSEVFVFPAFVTEEEALGGGSDLVCCCMAWCCLITDGGTLPPEGTTGTVVVLCD